MAKSLPIVKIIEYLSDKDMRKQLLFSELAFNSKRNVWLIDGKKITRESLMRTIRTMIKFHSDKDITVSIENVYCALEVIKKELTTNPVIEDPFYKKLSESILPDKIKSSDVMAILYSSRMDGWRRKRMREALETLGYRQQRIKKVNYWIRDVKKD